MAETFNNGLSTVERLESLEVSRAFHDEALTETLKRVNQLEVDSKACLEALQKTTDLLTDLVRKTTQRIDCCYLHDA